MVVTLSMAAGCTKPTGAESLDRLVILDANRRVVTMTPDGGKPTFISNEGDIGFQPTWSPDGTHIAYSYTTPDGDFGMAVADVDTGEVHEAPVPLPVFYLHWSPDSARVGTLRNDMPGGIAFEIVTLGESGLETEHVDSGSSYYFSWSPRGEDIAVHVGADRMDVIHSGDLRPVDDAPGGFQAPQWIDTGIISVGIGSGRPVVTRFDVDGRPDPLVEVTGDTAFQVSPDAARLAVQSSGGPGLAVSQQVADPLRPNRVHTVDLATGEVDEVLDHLVAGFWWSPDGERLLLVDAIGGERPQLVWRIWENEAVTDGPGFQPDPSWFRELLPFIDQYNRSMTPWAPDSTTFAFPGSVDGEAGIWVHDVDSGTTKRVADGTWVAWSPS